MNKLMIILIIWLAVISACSKSTPIPADQNNDQPKETGPSKLEMVSQSWDIDTAYHNGVHDASSTSKHISFEASGSYDFNGSFQGNWYFTQDSTTLIIDEGTSFQQEWTIVDLSEERFEANFNSPFTGKPAIWIMYRR